MYSTQERANIQNHLISKAELDDRIKDAAIVGSESIGKNDKWSDIDLTFGVRNDTSIDEVMEDWSSLLISEHKASILFDLKYGASTYRVFLMPNCLQIDLSFTPSINFGSITDKFKLLFGEEKERPKKQLPNVQDEYGYAVLYALKSRCSIERNKLWQAAYFINCCRDYVLKIACLKYNLNPFDGRGYDKLPEEVKNRIKESFNLSINKNILINALKTTIESLIYISRDLTEIKNDLTPQLKMMSVID